MALISEVKVHPVVLFVIVDSYERRGEGAHRVIGTLFGTCEQGVVEVIDCYRVPHEESVDEIALDLRFDDIMATMYKKCNKSLQIVGWFSTNHEIVEHDMLILDYYKHHTKNPVSLLVDTSLRNMKIDIKAYASATVGVPDKRQGMIFSPVPITITSYPNERNALDVLRKSCHDPRRIVHLSSDLHQVADASSNLQDMIAELIQYVDRVIAGEVKPDPQIGRALADLVNSVPNISPEMFQELLNSNMKDLLMVVYLSKLTQTQLTLTEKISLL